MARLSNLGKVIIVATVAAILIVLTIVYGLGGAHQNAAQNFVGGDMTGAALTANSPAQTANTFAIGSSTATTPVRQPSIPAVKSPAPPVIEFITPVKDDVWKIGTQNPISWNKPGDITGSISLIDAATQQFVGVILPEVGPNQTSYAWNTRDVLIDRSNPLKKDVVPGSYEIKISYDGNNIRPVTSPVFMITN